MDDILLRDLEQLLVYPREDLDVEIKSWLDLTSGEHKANLAQAILALANHGGGFILIGFKEDGGKYVPDPNRPPDASIYSQDNINGIVKRYADPPFHSEVYHVSHPESKENYPVIVVPGGHKVPIRAKKDGPNGAHVRKDLYYTRRPGPASEPPQSSDEWNELIRRCIVAGKEDLISSIRGILFGMSETAPVGKKDIRTKMLEWVQESREHWETLTNAYLKENNLLKIQYGFYTIAYMIEDEITQPSLSSFLDILARIKGHESGWPPWWVPTRSDITPYPYDGLIECWIKSNYPNDQSHADFL
jgi:hypothetical protein